MRAELLGGPGIASPILAQLGGQRSASFWAASRVSSCELLCNPDFGDDTMLLMRSAAGTIPPRLRRRRVRHLPVGKLADDSEWETSGGPF